MFNVSIALFECWMLNVNAWLQFLRECDQIVYLRDGHVVESGPHEDLLEARGTYFDFYRSVEEVDLQRKQSNIKIQNSKS